MQPTRMQEDRTPSSRRSSELMSEMWDSCHVRTFMITYGLRMDAGVYVHA